MKKFLVLFQAGVSGDYDIETDLLRAQNDVSILGAVTINSSVEESLEQVKQEACEALSYMNEEIGATEFEVHIGPGNNIWTVEHDGAVIGYAYWREVEI